MNLAIKNNRAISDKIGFISYSKLKSKFEGRTVFLKDGALSFEPTQQNIAFWLSQYPETIFDNQDIKLDDKFELYLSENRPTFAFKREPMPHQQNAFDKFKNKKLTAIFGDVGSGKSKILSDYASYKYCQGEIDAVIIIAINRLVIQQWHDSQLPRDISHEFQSWVWDKSKSGMVGYEAIKNYNGLQIITMNIDAIKTPSGKDLLLDFIKHHNGRCLFAVDESQTIKSATAARSKVAVALAQKCSHRSILTGTPIAKNLLDYWAQFLALDVNIIGTPYASTFKSKYCVTRWNGFADEIIGSKNEQELYGKTDPYTFRITKAELGFKEFDDEFEFSLGPKETQYYEQMKKSFLMQLDNGEISSATTALTAIIRMQQVSNGFVVREDGSLEILECSRLEAFGSLIETLSDDKIVVWSRFLNDTKLLLDKYPKYAISLSGDVSQKQRQQNKEQFLTDKNIRFAFGTPAASGTGVDSLQTVTNRAIYYSNGPNALEYWQSRARTSRVGGGSNAFYTHLIGKKTIDKKWLSNLMKKEALSSLILDDIRKMFE